MSEALPGPQKPTNLPARPEEEPEAERLISVFLRTLTSPQTAKTYNTEIRMFVAVVGEEGLGREGLGDVKAEDVSLYRERLLGRYAPATAAKKLAASKEHEGLRTPGRLGGRRLARGRGSGAKDWGLQGSRGREDHPKHLR